MRAVFGKLLPLFLALLIIQLFIIIVVVIWTYQDSSGLLKSAYDFIGKSPVAFDVFNFIMDFAEIISGIVVLLALFILVISLRKYQRSRAVNRLHNWARNSVVVLAQYRQANPDTGDPGSDRYEGVRVLLDKLITNSKFAIADARALRGEINDKTRKTVEALHAIREKLANEDDSLFDDLQTLQHDFADIMILAFEFIK
jgi:hypothetical protein